MTLERITSQNTNECHTKDKKIIKAKNSKNLKLSLKHQPKQTQKASFNGEM